MIDGTFTEDEWAFLTTEFELPAARTCAPPFEETSACSTAFTLGRLLFFEPALSGPVLIDDPAAPEPGTLSCAGCHDPANYFIDTRSQPRNLSIGAAAKRTKHNAMSVVNLAYKEAQAARNCDARPDDPLCARVFAWTGRYPSAAEVLILAGPNAMNTDGARISAAIRAKPVSYLAPYRVLFGASPPDCVPDVTEQDELVCGCPVDEICHSTGEVFTNVSRLFDAYLRRLVAGPSPFDRYIQTPVENGQTINLVEGFGEREQRGLAVFLGKGTCIDCHGGPLFSDLRFHNTGVGQRGPNVVPIDDGLAGPMDLNDPTRAGEFLTPPLRHVAMTAPYMHAGQLDSLGEVIEFYRRGGDPDGFVGRKDPRIQPLEITDDEARDLEAFLGAITGRDETGAWAAPEPVLQ